MLIWKLDGKRVTQPAIYDSNYEIQPVKKRWALPSIPYKISKENEWNTYLPNETFSRPEQNVAEAGSVTPRKLSWAWVEVYMGHPTKSNAGEEPLVPPRRIPSTPMCILRKRFRRTAFEMLVDSNGSTFFHTISFYKRIYRFIKQCLAM